MQLKVKNEGFFGLKMRAKTKTYTKTNEFEIFEIENGNFAGFFWRVKEALQKMWSSQVRVLTGRNNKMQCVLVKAEY